jgi:hypothetical protein
VRRLTSRVCSFSFSPTYEREYAQSTLVALVYF